MTPLRQKLMDAVLQRGYSIGTYVNYAVAVKQLIKFYHRPPDQISLCELQPFFEYLVKERKLAPATCHGYLAGIQFFYKNVMGWSSFEVPIIVPKKPQRIPELLTRSEVASIIDQLSNLKHRTMLQTCYGCGLRRPAWNRRQVGPFYHEQVWGRATRYGERTLFWAWAYLRVDRELWD